MRRALLLQHCQLLLYSRLASMLQPAPSPACFSLVSSGRLPLAAPLLREQKRVATDAALASPPRRAQAASALTGTTNWHLRRLYISVAPVRAAAKAQDAAEAAGGAEADSSEAAPAGLDGAWGGFLEQLWARGYFKDRTSADL